MVFIPLTGPKRAHLQNGHEASRDGHSERAAGTTDSVKARARSPPLASGCPTASLQTHIICLKLPIRHLTWSPNSLHGLCPGFDSFLVLHALPEA
jgi:hypothetical protein